MTLDITVRGYAEQHHPAERATVSLAIAIEGSEKHAVLADAVAIQEPMSKQLRDLVDMQAARTWSSDQVRVYSHRPWVEEGKRGDTVHVARVQVSAEFTDFERLSGFLDYWSGVEGIEVDGITWDVTSKNRGVYESEARKSAVDDAMSKAQSYANAVRRGKVTAVQIADPGMLAGPGDISPAPPMLFRSGSYDGSAGGGPQLDLKPEEIVIRVEVDARFRAD